jgi:heat shock protein HslJ
MKSSATIFAAVLLAGCSSAVLEQQHGYRVVSISGAPVSADTHLSLTLDNDGRVYGNAGCNHFFGSYQLQGKALSFGQLGSTRRMCPEAAMKQEKAFLERLARNTRWSNKDGQIRLLSASREPIVLVRDTR